MFPSTDVDPEAVLHAAGRIAAYRWGALTLETTSLAPTEGRAMVRAVAGVIAGNLASDSDIAQRGQLALLHELVHYQQDLSTGLGAWDHLVTRDAMGRLAYHAKWFVTEDTPAPYADRLIREIAARSPTDTVVQMRADRASIRERMVGRRLLQRRDWWDGPGMSEALAEAEIPYLPDDLADFSLRAMFETEAAALVWSTVRGARYDTQSLDWLEEHRPLWHLNHLHVDYTMPLVQMAQFLSDPGEEVTDASLGSQLPVLILLITFLVDWASGYPPPGQLSDEASAARYNPVLRFVVGLRSLRAMTGADFSELLTSLLDFQPLKAEQILDSSSKVAYLPSKKIYGAWIDHLTPSAEADSFDAPLFEARCHAMRARLRQRSPKGILAVPDACSMVQVIVDGQGMRGVMSGAQLLDTGKVMHALLVRQQDIALYEWLYEDRPFRCPWGRANTCDSAQDSCRMGLTAVTELPAHGCRVRDDLEEAGYCI